jgi:hypothetical protein
MVMASYDFLKKVLKINATNNRLLGVTLKVINDKSFAIQSFLESVTIFKGNGMLPLMVMAFY